VKRVAVALTLLIPLEASAFAPAHVVHGMVGQMRPAAGPNVRITLRVDCVFYEDSPECSGTWRCESLPGEPNGCRHRQGRAFLDIRSTEARCPIDGDPCVPASLMITFPDGTSCQLAGTVPYLFGGAIPGISGQYVCRDGDGLETERGVLGVRTRSIGKPFRVFH
jgi:hypothetical protein